MNDKANPSTRSGLPYARKRIVARLLFAATTGWGYRCMAIVCNLVNISLFFRFLPKEVVGLWFLMLGAQTFLGLFDFGFGQTLQRRVAYFTAESGVSPDIEPDENTRLNILGLLSLARRVYVLISMLIFVVILVVGWIYFSSLKLSPSALSEFRLAWIVMSLGYAANTWGFMVESSLNGLGDIGWANVVNAVAQVATLIANWIVLTLGLGLQALAIIWLFKGLFIRVTGWAIVKIRHKWVHLHRASLTIQAFQDMVPPSLRWWLALVGYFMMAGVGQYLIARFLGAAALPDYAATYSALTAVQGAMVGIVAAGSPLYSQLLKAGENAYVRETLLTLTRYSLGAIALAFGFLGVWGRQVFEFWLGKGHFVGYPILGILIVLMFAEAHQGMLQAACVAAEKLDFYKAVLVGGILTLGLSFILIPKFGLLGAAISALAGQATTQDWVTPKLAMRVLQIRYIDGLKRVLIPGLSLGGAVFFIGMTLKAVHVPTVFGIAMTFIGTIVISFLFYRKFLGTIRMRFQVARANQKSHASIQ